MEDLLKTLDPQVFTPELVEKIKLVFESAVEAKVSSINEQTDKYSSYLQEEYQSKLQSLEEGYNSKVAELKEEYENKAEEYSNYVVEHYETKAEEYSKYLQEEYENTLDSYMDKVVEGFVEENKIVIEESVKQAKVDALLEGFDSLLIAGAVSLADITEARSETQEKQISEDAVSEYKAEISKLIKENASLKADKNKWLQESIYSSAVDKMSLAQKDAFARVAKSIKFEDEASYKESLNKLSESIVSLSEVSEGGAPLNESTKDIQNPVKSKYSRFI